MNPASRHLGLMIALTFVTGLVDAGGYLGLDRVFVGNMTGNVVILGMGAAGADGLPVLGPALALATFIFGAGIAGLSMRSSPAGWSPRLSAVVVGSVLLVAATAILIGFASSDDVKVVAAAMTAFAMGMQAAAARKVGVADVTTVVVTSTITVWAVDMFARPSRATILNRRIAAIVAILLGALVGALLVEIALWLVFAVAAVLGGVVAVVGHGTMLAEGRLAKSGPEARS
ncbi:YoaK family protein [Gordonia sp. CPCC 206044]|uniref:YoaK family protein n=1 Tax=Gordonia sp. CPCC 206044 TaxID=3140793 RepID=UPI003AF37ADD